jgi:hypothetical protein
MWGGDWKLIVLILVEATATMSIVNICKLSYLVKTFEAEHVWVDEVMHASIYVEFAHWWFASKR